MSLYLDLLTNALLDELYGPRWKWGPDDPFPARALTMVERDRLQNVRQLCESAVVGRIPGDFVECGVWRGGCAIMMAACAKYWAGFGPRTTWVCDSFQGVPPPTLPQDAGIHLNEFKQLAVPQAEVEENFRRFGFLDERVEFLPGWFKDTLPGAPIESIAVLRLDGDLYASTMDALNNLYHKVSPGGFVIIDDYGAIEACAKAVHEFRDAHGITAPLVRIDQTGVYWRVVQ